MSSLVLSVAPKSGSLRTAGLAKLERLCNVLAVPQAQRREATALFEEISHSWGDWAVGDAPHWPSDITDDGTPFEFSVAFERNRFELRMLFESQSLPFTSRSSWDAGVSFCERLRKSGAADLSLFDRVSDLFAPTTQTVDRFSLWHAAVLRDQARLYKVYFNPEIEDPTKAPQRVDVALDRIGLPAARRFIKTCVTGLPFVTRLPYFSIDLERPESARAKIYLSADSAAHAAAIVAETGGLDPATCASWLESLVGDEQPQRKRPILVCVAYRHGLATPDVTVHVPIRCFADNDSDAAERLVGVLSATEIPRLRRVLEAVSGHAPASTCGVLTYASMRLSAGALRVTGYLAPQLYASPIAGISGTHSVEPKSE
jgi:DMATS type aromatic prenyltransferase